MISRRAFCLGIVSVFAAGSAEATPGAVNKNGCHGRPRHCHDPSEIRATRGRRYVPGFFPRSYLPKRRKKRR